MAERPLPFPYDVPRLLDLRERIARLEAQPDPTLDLLHGPVGTPRRIAVVAGSFNPLTHGHTALAAAVRAEVDDVLLLLPLRAIDKEAVTRAAPEDRTLVLLQWAQRRSGIAVALVNRGLYVEQAALLAAQYPGSEIAFVVGHDKVVQIFDPRYYAERDEALRALFRLATLRVAPRAGRGSEALHALLQAPENRPFAAAVTPLAPDEDVEALSSTAVRAAVRAGEPWEEMVPEETAAFMREALPYSPPVPVTTGEVIDAYGLRLTVFDAVAAGRLAPDADVMALCRAGRAATPAGRELRAWLAQDGQAVSR